MGNRPAVPGYVIPEGTIHEDIAKLKYFFPGESTWSEVSRRAAKQASVVEDIKEQPKWEKKFYDAINSADLVPGGRILFGAGRPNYNMLNCYVLEPDDSVASIGKMIQDMYKIACSGGGIGFNYSNIRPKGDSIQNIPFSAPGSISTMKMINEIGSHVKAGKSRRTALIAILNVSHPDFMEFLDAKLDRHELTNFNISVGVSDRFLEAVENNEDWYFTFGGRHVRYDQYSVRRESEQGVDNVKVIAKSEEDALGVASAFHLLTPSDTFSEAVKVPLKAKELWDRILRNAVECGEPGIFNLDYTNQFNNVSYFETLNSTNPCVAGDSIIAVADGRNGVSIKELADKGEDVPVYSTNLTTGQVEIKMGRNPRMTGQGSKVWKLTLDDGSVLIATPNHKILTKELEYVNLSDLHEGQSVFPWNSFNSNGYRQISNVGAKMTGGARRNRRQYRVMAEFNGINVDPKTTAIHHIDCNSLNDSMDNLQAMPHGEHRQLHAEKMKGKDNPYHKMTDEWKVSFATHTGEDNGRWKDVSNDELVGHGRKVFANEGKFTKKLWQRYAIKKGLPISVNRKCRFTSFSAFKSLVIGNHKVVSVEEVGTQDVYNITVDDNHNYHVITSHGDGKYVKSSGICVKNCGEQPLPAFGNCCLGHVNLANMVSDEGVIDWRRIARTIRLGVRYLDDILEVNTFPIEECREVGHRSRRIGLGVLGFATFLIKAGYRYGSESCIEFTERLFETFRNEAYKASMYLAREKGSFEAYDWRKLKDEQFMKTLPARIRSDIKKNGLRNASLLTVAPTGTVAMVVGVSTGIEPIFSPVYKRRWKTGTEDVYNEALVIDPLFKKMFLEGRDVSHIVGAYDVTPEEHIKMQVAIQSKIDAAISKTCNLPSTAQYSAELSEMVLGGIGEMKGLTFYKAGSRGNEPLEAIDHSTLDLDVLIAENKLEILTESVDTCKSGVCEI